ncbi:hypothetical protein [Arenibacter sp. S6351L]|uniref:hypothetical protein n=1 Tax=Arenibacter sp. S6351L TaxID=2926407 RepID=UPI001FF3F27B|nr:hypothetical protein [Arenibacter sp. S6351L]MCK0136798.1 hypothetical protein [Arenibacter sp. S6351L]
MNANDPNLLLSAKNTFRFIGIGVIGLLGLTGCTKDDPMGKNGQLAISAKSNYVSPTGKTATTDKASTNSVVLSDFLLNLKEFELELDIDDQEDDNEQWDDDGYFDFEDEIELEGPFELDLLAGEISFLTASVPMGKYEEIEFKFDKSTDETSELFEKSILIKGTINNIPFVFWHNFEDELELDFEDPQFDITVSSGTENLSIEFDLSLLFNSVNGVNLSQAVDGNNNGTIEISPVDTDGNNEIAQELRDRFKDFIDLLDD